MTSPRCSTPDAAGVVGVIESPIGGLRVTALDGAIVRLDHVDSAASAGDDGPAAGPVGSVLEAALDQLAAYFAGARRSFDLPLEPGGTDFERRVWAELRRIPFGETRSYAEIATALGDPGAVRAVGRANGRNPLSIVVPCHRVIGSDGSLTGYAGGLERKAALLRHEGALLV